MHRTTYEKSSRSPPFISVSCIQIPIAAPWQAHQETR
jgi:hypothetical protein